VLLTHLPQFKSHYGVSDGTVTIVVVMVTLLAGVGSLLSELLANRTSSRTALRAELVVVAVAGVIVGAAPHLWVFIAGFAVYGLGVGGVDATANMQAVAVQHRYGRSIITSFHAAWSAAAIAGALYVSGGERISLSLPVSILPISAVVLLIGLFAGPALLRKQEQPAEVSRSAAAASGDGAPAATVPRSDPVREVVVTAGPLLLLGLAMTCFWSVDAGVSNWGALYLHDLLKASGSTAALGYAAYQATGLISRLGGDFAVRRVGAVATVRAGSAIATLGTVVVVLAPGPAVAILGFGITGLGLPVVAPLCFSSASAAARLANGGSLEAPPGPAEVAAVDSVVARLNVFNYLGSLIGAVVVGAVGTAVNLRIGFVVPILLAVAVFFLARGFAPADTPARSDAARPAAA
jgi:MFS family permease